PRNVRCWVDGLFSRCSRRQGMSFNDGIGFDFRNLYLSEAGRSGLDLEPYGANWIVEDGLIDNVVIHNVKNGGVVTHSGCRNIKFGKITVWNHFQSSSLLLEGRDISIES